MTGEDETDPLADAGAEPTEAGHAVAAQAADAEVPRSREGRSFAALWAALGVAVLVLGGGLFYLFSMLPDPAALPATQHMLADLRAEVTALQGKPQPDLAATTQRLDALEKQVAGARADLATLQSRTASTNATQAGSAETGALAAKLDAVSRDVGSIRDAQNGAKRQADDLEHRVATLDGRLASLPKVDLGPLTMRVEALDSRLKPLEDEQNAAKSPARVTEVRQNGSGAETRAAPLAVTAEAVARAVDAGKPFAPDLAVLASLGADPGTLQPLRAVADGGAPTTKDLRADLASLRDKLSVQSAPAPSGSYFDRLMAGAVTMVRVRPLGSVVGDTPPAILARLDDDLGRDDLTSALAEWQKLPEQSRDLGRGLADRIRLRLAAQEAAHTIGGAAIKAMAVDHS